MAVWVLSRNQGIWRSELHPFRQDVKFALRQLRRSPGFTIAITTTLAISLGAVIGIFIVVDGILLRPLPYPQPDRLMEVSTRYDSGPEYHVIRSAQFRFLQQFSQAFDSIALYEVAPSGVNLSGSGDPESVQATYVTADFFRVLGITPTLGRAFSGDQDRPQEGCVAVITDGLFVRRYNQNPSILTQGIRVNEHTCNVIGVLPKGFRFEYQAEVFLPLQVAAEPRDLGHYFRLLGRLKPAMTAEGARAELQTLFPQFKKLHGDLVDDGETGFRAEAYQRVIVGNTSAALWVLLGSVFLLHLIACVNVAHLQLARASTRTKEMAVRAALGAQRTRLLRQSITESAILAFLGTSCGVGVCLIGLPILLQMAPSGIPRIHELAFHFEVVVFASMMSVVTLLISGLGPALLASHTDLNSLLKAGPLGRTTGTLRGLVQRGFIGTEVALSVVLLTGALLLIRSFSALEKIDPGFDPHQVLVFKISLPPSYASTSQVSEFEGAVRTRLLALPGVDQAASATSLPMESGPDMPGVIFAQSSPVTMNPAYRPVSPGYFHVLGIPFVRGRGFTDADTSTSTPVAVINETLARQAFGDRDAVGQRLKLGVGLDSEFADSTREIVGVVHDVRETSLAVQATATVFIPRAQIPDTLSLQMNKVLPISWAVRTKIPPKQMIDSVRRAVISVNSEQPISDVRTMDQELSATLDRQRFTTWLMTIFASVALLLASVGVYGVTSYQVRQRQRELSMRVALGAIPRSLLFLITLARGKVIGVSILIGLGTSLVLARLIGSLLFEVRPNDPVSFIASAGVLAVLALVAVYVPARRGCLADPMKILRDE